MDVSCKFRPKLSRLTFVFVGLVISVFTWGLQYKLSLYQGKDAISHQMPEAKLLSQRERPTIDRVVSVRPSPLPVFPLFPVLIIAAVASALFKAAARYAPIGSVERSLPAFPPCLQAIFLRPPPAVL
jgi:hypothetical protein